MLNAGPRDAVICIAGMHRSGTSMISRLLNLAGVYLGPAEDLLPPADDNPEGFWENGHFALVNQRILSEFGGRWDAPPAMPPRWQRDTRLVPVRRRAAALIADFAEQAPWGWKDPRNCLTLEFWRDLIPGLKVLVSLRNPLDVAASLAARNGLSEAFSLDLWSFYHEQLLARLAPQDRVVTHYDAYFDDPERELARVLGLLGLHTRRDVVGRACRAIKTPLRHSRSSATELGRRTAKRGVLNRYAALCAEAEFTVSDGRVADRLENGSLAPNG